MPKEQKNQETIQDTKIEARAFPIAEPRNNVVAFASVTIDDKIAISGMRILNSEKGMFVSMPQVKDDSGKYRDIAFPVMEGLRAKIQDSVLNEYATALDAMVEKKESAVAKMREAAVAAKNRPAPEKATEKTASKGTNKADDAL